MENGLLTARISSLEKENMEVKLRFADRMDKLCEDNNHLMKSQEKMVLTL